MQLKNEKKKNSTATITCIAFVQGNAKKGNRKERDKNFAY